MQVYVPGPGWVDFDPSSGMVGNQNLVRVAVVREPREAIPLQGTWIGTASDHLAMKVAVKVIAAADADAGCGQRRHDDAMTLDLTAILRQTARSVARLVGQTEPFGVSFLLDIRQAPLARAEGGLDENSCGLRDFL